MGYLHIANCTRQRQTIAFRLDINRNGELDPRMQNAAAKQQTIETSPVRLMQAVVGGDLHPNQIEDIIRQLTPYGLVGVVDVPNNLVGFTPLVFNIDAPVPERVMRAVYDYNQGIRIMEGGDRRRRAAIGANQALEGQLQPDMARPPEFDVEFEQEEVSENDEKSISEGFHVKRDGAAPPTPGQGRGKRAA